MIRLSTNFPEKKKVDDDRSWNIIIIGSLGDKQVQGKTITMYTFVKQSWAEHLKKNPLECVLFSQICLYFVIYFSKELYIEHMLFATLFIINIFNSVLQRQEKKV